MLKFKNLPNLFSFLVLSFVILQGGLLAQDATEDYQNTPIEPQTGVFAAQFNAMATADSVDGVLGFSKVEPAGYGDYSCKVLFNNEGFITANNGGDFEADSALAYTAGQSYAVRVLINIPAQTFSVWVTPEGGEAVLIGKDYAFSPKAGVVESINYRSVKMSFGKWGGNEGVVKVTDFAISYAIDSFVNIPIEPQTGIFMAQFNAISTADSVDGVLGFSKMEPAGYGDYSCKVLFNNEGFITANNGGSFEADSAFAYAAGQVYAVKVLINIPAQTFSAWVTPEGGDAVTIGKDFAFSPKAGVVDSINYRSIKMSFGKWGGNEGIVQVSDFQITPVIEGGKTCVFIGSKPYPGADADLLLIAHLEENYDLTIVDDDSVMDGVFSIDDLREYDFAFVSESASTWRLSSAPDNIYKLAPVPMFYTECYASKASVAGWVSAEGFFGTINDSTGEGRKVIIVDEENHPLAAGFANGAEVEIVSGTNDTTSLGTLTYSVPEIDYIPIAVWIGDPDLSVVFGVEAGTPLWDDLGLTVDPNFVSENRTAAVGIFAPANDFITEDGYKLIDAGINWILGIETAVAERVATAPATFELSQNYPNPFNPSTEISFSLAERGYTTLTVYNVIGQKIAALVNEELDAGLHHLTFKADNIPSGVYFYQLQSGEFNQIKKMMLIR